MQAFCQEQVARMYETDVKEMTGKRSVHRAGQINNFIRERMLPQSNLR